MTGPLLINRQMSSTAGKSNVDKKARRSLRRSSSADSRHSMDPIPDEKQYFVKPSETRPRFSTENDSGTEDLSQPAQQLAGSPVQDHNDDAIFTEFGACEDEGYQGAELPPPEEESRTALVQRILHDRKWIEGNLFESDRTSLFLVTLASCIPHDEKKMFCPDTVVAFHAEFARLLSLPIYLEYPGCRFRLFADGELEGDACCWPGFAFVSLDNAKAQFKCPACQRLWTSMRARIAFKISFPQEHGFVVLKIFGQNCQGCGTPADALWYMGMYSNVKRTLFSH